LRDEQARATQKVIVDAAARLFGEKGYAAVSVDAIAAFAGVSRATVFNSFAGKPALLKAAYDAAFGRAAGAEDEAIPFVERPRSRAVRAQPTAQGYLEGYADMVVVLCHHLARLHEALREAAPADPEARRLLDEVSEVRRRGAATIVADVRARAPLQKGLDEVAAADAVWALNDPSLFYMLVHRRGWPEERFRDWFVRLLKAELLGPDPESKPPRPRRK
jgi:AcrR family transcriptional regulator